MAIRHVCDRCNRDATSDLHTVRLGGDANDVMSIEIELCRMCYCELRQVVGNFVVPEADGATATRAWWRSFTKEET